MATRYTTLTQIVVANDILDRNLGRIEIDMNGRRAEVYSLAVKFTAEELRMLGTALLEAASMMSTNESSEV